jgi:hypothetical protein
MRFFHLLSHPAPPLPELHSLACIRPLPVHAEPDGWLWLAALVVVAAGRFAMRRPR